MEESLTSSKPPAVPPSIDPSLDTADSGSDDHDEGMTIEPLALGLSSLYIFLVIVYFLNVH